MRLVPPPPSSFPTPVLPGPSVAKSSSTTDGADVVGASVGCAEAVGVPDGAGVGAVVAGVAVGSGVGAEVDGAPVGAGVGGGVVGGEVGVGEVGGRVGGAVGGQGACFA